LKIIKKKVEIHSHWLYTKSQEVVMGQPKEKKKQKTFRLSEGTCARLEAIAKLEYRDATNMVTALIETAYAQAYGTDGEVKK
jgi:hypothetical protein